MSATKATNTTAGTNWSLTSTYSDWYNFRGGSSGCFKCHTGVQNNKVALTNDELAAAQRKMQQAQYTGFEIVARSFEPVDYAFTAYHCLDGNGCDPDELAWTVMPLASGGLAARAKELHAQIPSAYQRSHSATAVMSVIDNADGELKYLVANNHGVTAEQRQILATNEIVVPYNKAMAPRHAELLALDYAEFFNMTPLEVAASWSVCPTCADELGKAGIKVLNPR